MRPANVVAVILALIPGTVYATAFSWDALGSGDFNDMFNWNPIAVPGATDTAAYDELGAYVVTHDGDFTNQSMTVTNGLVFFVPDSGAGRTYTLTSNADIQGTTLTLGGALMPMDLDVGNDLKLGSNGILIIDDISSVITQNLLLGSLASGGEGGIVVSGGSSLDVTGGGMVNLGANGFGGTISVDSSTLNIAGPLELATDSDPGTSGQLFVDGNATVTLSDVEIGGGTNLSSGAFILSTGGSVELSGAATLILGGVTGQGNGTISMSDDSQMTTGTGLTTILDTGLVDLDDTAIFTANGDLLVDDGRIDGEVATQLILGPGTTTTVQNSGAIDLMGTWFIEGSGGSRDVNIEAGADVDLFGLLSMGNSGSSAVNFTINGGDVQLGSILVGPQGIFSYLGGTLSVGRVTVIGGQFTTASDFDFDLAVDVNVIANGVITVGGIATIGTPLFVDGGSFIADDLNIDPADFTFTSGLVQLNNGLTIGNADVFGSNFTITQNHQLKTAATTTINAFTSLTLDGGLLETGTFVNNGTFDFQRGTLRITGGGGLTIGSGGALSANVSLPTDAILNVTNTTTIDAGSLLMVEDGGSLSAGTLNVNGELMLDGSLATIGAAAISNAGLVRGIGRVNGPVSNTGSIEAFDQAGELIFNGTVDNLASGLVALRDSAIRFNGGLDNAGQVSVGPGVADLLGDVDNSGTGIVGLSGGATLSIVGDLVQNGTLNLLTNSRAIVFENFSGTGGSTGPGTLEVLGTLSPGASPAEVFFGGDLVVGSSTLIELGGTIKGSQYDALDVAGLASLGGTLDVLLIDGFAPAPGDTFEIITAASVVGTFAAETLPALPGSLEWFVNYSGTSVELISTFAGDFDFDGDVDGNDFLLWQRDPSVGSLADWETNYGMVAPLSAASAAVPEPTAMLLACVAALMLPRRLRV